MTTSPSSERQELERGFLAADAGEQGCSIEEGRPTIERPEQQLSAGFAVKEQQWEQRRSRGNTAKEAATEPSLALQLQEWASKSNCNCI